MAIGKREEPRYYMEMAVEVMKFSIQERNQSDPSPYVCLNCGLGYRNSIRMQVVDDNTLKIWEWKYNNLITNYFTKSKCAIKILTNGLKKKRDGGRKKTHQYLRASCQKLLTMLTLIIFPP